MSQQNICRYFQARVDKARAWFVMGVFRNENNIVFVRAMDGSSDVFEFFVPQGMIEQFFPLVSFLEKNHYLSNFEEHPNRFKASVSSET